MVGSLAGRNAVVTGASSGIGRELARRLAAGGTRVGLVARRAAELHELREQIAARGGTAVVAVADVADRTQAELAVASIRSQLGPIDLVIANAGIGRSTEVDPPNVTEIEDTIRVNLLGVIYTLSAALPEMLARKSGHLVAISSLAAYRGLPGKSAYCASKAAVNVFLDGLRVQLRGTGVRVTTVCPGFVRTAMTAGFDFPLPQLMEVEEAAARILAAIERGTKVYNFPLGLHLLVRLSRWLPDWLLQRLVGEPTGRRGDRHRRDKTARPGGVTPP
jgi:short-subunit dehydrogenase